MRRSRRTIKQVVAELRRSRPHEQRTPDPHAAERRAADARRRHAAQRR